MDCDLKIVDGCIIDGTGREHSRDDLGVKAGIVVAIGQADGNTRQTVTAGGLIAIPGFVDIHTHYDFRAHYDAKILWDRMLSISPWHEVMTVAMGNCGFGLAPTRAEHRRLIRQTAKKIDRRDEHRSDGGRAWAEAWLFQSCECCPAARTATMVSGRARRI